MAILSNQKNAAALYYAVFGKNTTSHMYDDIGRQLELKDQTIQTQVSQLLKSSGQSLYNGMTKEQIVAKIYSNVYGHKPSDKDLNTLMFENKSNSVAGIAAQIVEGLLNYNGVDSQITKYQITFEQHINDSLYPATVAEAKDGASDVQAFFYSLGSTQVADGINYWGTLLSSGKKTREEVAKSFVSSKASQYSNEKFVKVLYANTYLREATAAESRYYVEKLNNGTLTREKVLISVIDDIRGENYIKTDAAARTQFLKATQIYEPGQLPSIIEQEKVSALFLAIPNRGVDASGLETWSKQLAYGVSDESLATRLVNSPEFLSKGASLEGDEFIQHVYSSVHGLSSKASENELSLYRKYGFDKGAVVVAIINDLRNSTAIDDKTVSQQHAYEAKIGQNLLYKKSAILNNSLSSENATGNVNTGKTHELTNAETATLENVRLFLTSSNDVSLKFADKLKKLEIGGYDIAKVTLSNNGVSEGVDIILKNGKANLDASSGNDRVIIDKAANIATSTAKINLEKGDDNIFWGGNSVKSINGGANQVSKSIIIDGGKGINTISANLITEEFNVQVRGWAKDLGTIKSNIGQFKNFQKIDLGGYTGKAVGTYTDGKIIDTQDHTFDFGLTNGTATIEQYAYKGSTTVEKPVDEIGRLGFVLSQKADNVIVTNVADKSAAQLEVTGDATKASKINFNFDPDNADATNFSIKFTAGKDGEVSGGTVSFNNAPYLKELDITSGGGERESNDLIISGKNNIESIKIDGGSYLNIKTIGDDLNSLKIIDAAKNESGVHIDSDLTGSGTSWLYYALKYIPVVSATQELAHNRSDVQIRGTSGDDIIEGDGATTMIGNGGNDTFVIKSSPTSELEANKTVVIADYGLSDVIIDKKSHVEISSTKNGNKVADYGTNDSSFWSKLFTGFKDLIGFLGVALDQINKFGQVMGLSDNKLDDKVGISTVGDKHFVIVDNNDNGRLDANDQVIILQGNFDHDTLVNNLHYKILPEINGVHSELTV
ncbi:DUF4214 domain-containing protein [Serratia marcescens]|uniref:DUF4214 domain-containing protein n=1 Tax=Serratia marcescens TaxID=615 RepID=UPI0027304660|nr:DUF4214 domain-containing protein [Serratia marcescens]MDP0522207.1 DUF4214 domain-containing protein [Serratia marcescens]